MTHEFLNPRYVYAYTIEFSKIQVHIRYTNSCLDYSPSAEELLIIMYA